MDITKFFIILETKNPTIKYRYTEDKKWYVMSILHTKHMHNFIINKKTLEKEETAYRRIKEISNMIKNLK